MWNSNVLINSRFNTPLPHQATPPTPQAFELVKIVSFKYHTQRLDLMVIFFVKGNINDSDYQFVYQHLSVDCLLVKVKLFTSNTSILKDKTRVFNWKGFTLPVQIPHPTQARFKFSNLQHTQKSNTSGLPQRGGCWSIKLIACNTYLVYTQIFLKLCKFKQLIYRLGHQCSINPLTPKSDLHLISPYNIIPESHSKVMRIKEMITN